MSAPDDRSGLERAGELAFVGLVVGGLAATFAALRVASDGDVAAPSAWAACAGVAAVPMLASVGVLRSARTGARSLAGEHAGARAIATFAWLVTMTGALDRLGAVLRAKTHHHALAGATFSLAALALGLGLALVCARLATALSDEPEAPDAEAPHASNRTRRLVASACVAVLAAVVLRDLARGLATLDPNTRAWLVDAGAFGLSALIGSGAPPLPRWSSRVGPVLLVLVLVLGAWARGTPAVRPRVAEHAPLYSLE